jgi:hypothetical protein
MNMESNDGMVLTGGNQRIQRKTCPSATLCTTKISLTDVGVNLDLLSERPATNHLSHGMALVAP